MQRYCISVRERNVFLKMEHTKYISTTTFEWSSTRIFMVSIQTMCGTIGIGIIPICT